METIGQYNLKKIIELNKRIDEIVEEVEELESDLCGAEINHPDHFHCVIEYIDGDNALLYVEDEEGETDNIGVTLDALLKLL